MTSTRISPTTITSGPYAGLQSASKRVRKTTSPDEEVAVRKNVSESKESTTSFGPTKKTTKKGGILKDV